MDSLYDSACGAYIYDEDVLDFLVKYDNNLAGEMQILQPDCRTIINSQFLVAYLGLRFRQIYYLGWGMIGYRNALV